MFFLDVTDQNAVVAALEAAGLDSEAGFVQDSFDEAGEMNLLPAVTEAYEYGHLNGCETNRLFNLAVWHDDAVVLVDVAEEQGWSVQENPTAGVDITTARGIKFNINPMAALAFELAPFTVYLSDETRPSRGIQDLLFALVIGGEDAVAMRAIAADTHLRNFGNH